MTIFGRQPAMIIQTIHAALLVLSAFWGARLHLDEGTVAAIQVLLTAAATAWIAIQVRPFAPTVFSGVIIAAVELLGRFGLGITDVQLGAVLVFVTSAVTMWAWSRQTPVVDPVETPATGPIR